METFEDTDYGKPIPAPEKVKCPHCGKLVSDVRLDQHIKAKHPGKN